MTRPVLAAFALVALVTAPAFAGDIKTATKSSKSPRGGISAPDRGYTATDDLWK
ncbi:MAG: hypothetical protein JXQ91_02580 [Vannielia sp.]|uniref:hypothetical protein n=1 Tax=Rhodobacterales TaxID=204455 RepID=UPI0020948F3D|nr:hypothetical protein [Oceanicola sp. 502str15]MCO6382188.1 hypothetical protein [Oceanicola sp. 502str15]